MSIDTREKQNSANSTLPGSKSKQRGFWTRRPLSAPGKVAMWASVVRTIAGIGGFIALTTENSSSQDVGIAAVLSFIIVVLLVGKWRWGPLITTVLGGYLLYDTFTQPYVLASLSNPYGSSGGFGKFIWVVIAMAISILVFGGSIGAAIQNYSRRDPKTSLWLPAGLTLVAGLMIGAIFMGSFAHPAAPTGTTYTNGMPTVHIGDVSFNQSSVTVPQGSKLVLVDDTQVEHELFNGSWQNGKPVFQREAGAPVVNGVILKGNSVTIGPFNTAGTYHIMCSIHPAMMLTIIVQ